MNKNFFLETTMETKIKIVSYIIMQALIVSALILLIIASLKYSCSIKFSMFFLGIGQVVTFSYLFSILYGKNK
ncbi:MAG: hypothetical protein GX895_08130 [Clostridiales bacterium]|nr:hypothetical protein [Clostridiales bacterium]